MAAIEMEIGPPSDTCRNEYSGTGGAAEGSHSEVTGRNEEDGRSTQSEPSLESRLPPPLTSQRSELFGYRGELSNEGFHSSLSDSDGRPNDDLPQLSKDDKAPASSSQPNPTGLLRWNPIDSEFLNPVSLYNYQVAALQQRDYFAYPCGPPVSGPSTARKLWSEGGALRNSFRSFRNNSLESILSTAQRPGSSKFESLLNIIVAVLVTGHAVFVALETSYRYDPRIHKSEIEYFRTTWKVLIVINSCFTFAYGVELVLRLANRGYKSLWGFDMQFAVSIVVCGLITDVLGWKAMRASATIPRDVLQCLGVLRIFRILVDNSGGFCFRGISLAVRGLVFSLISLGWITFIMFVVLYSFANIATRVFTGPLELVTEESIVFRWGSVSSSIYTLFLMLSFDGWSDVALETLDVFAFSPIFFVIFIAVSGVVLLNVVISVMVDSYLRASRALITDEKYRAALQQEEKHQQRRERVQKRQRKQLQEMHNRGGSSSSSSSWGEVRRSQLSRQSSGRASEISSRNCSSRSSSLVDMQPGTKARREPSTCICDCCCMFVRSNNLPRRRSTSLVAAEEAHTAAKKCELLKKRARA